MKLSKTMIVLAIFLLLGIYLIMMYNFGSSTILAILFSTLLIFSETALYFYLGLEDNNQLNQKEVE